LPQRLCQLTFVVKVLSLEGPKRPAVLDFDEPSRPSVKTPVAGTSYLREHERGVVTKRQGLSLPNTAGLRIDSRCLFSWHFFAMRRRQQGRKAMWQSNGQLFARLICNL
jgi:hypothetical protein